MKKLLTYFCSMFLCCCLKAYAGGEYHPSDEYQIKYHVYVGLDWSAVSAEKFKIENANASFADVRLGWEPFSWLGLEHRQSFYGGDDKDIKFGLKLGSEDIKGDYLRFRHKFNNITGSLSVGRVTVGNYIDFPAYPASPDIWDQLFALVDPEGVLPEELRSTTPGRYHYDKTGISYGVGFEGQIFDAPKWRWSLEYEYVGEIDGWKWSNYYLGFKRYF